MPPANDVSDTLLFSEQRQPNMQMESRDGNTIRLGRFKPDKGQWWQLSESLERHGWSWTRDNVEEADIFVSLSGKYAALTEEMLRLDFVDGGRIKTITPRGQQWFIEQSPRLFDEHIR